MSEQFLYFLQQMFNGVTLGSTYALIAIGYTMVYGIIGMINFAHGEVYMIGSYVSFMIIAALMMMGIDTGWLLVAAGFVGAIVIASAYGWSIERVAYRPVRNSKRLIALISAIGMSIFLQNYVSLTEGSRDVALPSLFNGQWVVGHSENFSASITTIQQQRSIAMTSTMEGDVLLDTGCFYPDFQRTRNPRGISQSFKNKCFIIVWTYAA